jgi:UDP-glucose 4-epimerase
MGNGVNLQVLVTGATGFLGKALVKQLNAVGYEVTGVARRSASVSLDLTDPETTRKVLSPARWDIVVNLAGPIPSRGGDTGDWQVIRAHAGITLNICSLLPPGWNGRLIHVSSMAVYGLPQHLPVRESHSHCPVDAYGIAKCVAEEIVVSAAAEKNFKTAIVRLPGLFSENRHDGAMYNFTTAAARGLSLSILASRPTAWEVLHLEDAVEAIIRLMRSPHSNPGAVNIGYGVPMSLPAMAAKIVRCLGSRSAVVNQTGVCHPDFSMDITKAARLIDWPFVTFDERLERYCAALSGAWAI